MNLYAVICASFLFEELSEEASRDDNNPSRKTIKSGHKIATGRKTVTSGRKFVTTVVKSVTTGRKIVTRGRKFEPKHCL